MQQITEWIDVFEGATFTYLQDVYPICDAINQSGDKRPVCSLCPFSEHILLELSSTGLRKFIHNFNLPWHHEPTYTAFMLSPFDYVLTFDVPAGLNRDESLGPFAPVRIGYRDHCCFKYIRVSRKHRF